MSKLPLAVQGLICKVIHRSYPQARKPVYNPLRHAVNERNSYPHLDSRVYAGRIQWRKGRIVKTKSDCFYSLSSSIKRDKDKRLLAFLALLTLIALLGVSTAYASPSAEAYKLYAHMKLGSDKQYRCLVDLWTMESHWNPRADNPKSSAYGIPQLLNMKSTNPYVQIDKGLLYIAKRYGLPCKALAYHSKKGHY